MTLGSADELVARALEVVRSGEMGAGPEEEFDSGVALEAALHRLYPMSGTWRLKEGYRLQRLRRVILRVLAPFVDRQDELNDALRVAVVLLAREVDWLKVQLEESKGQADSEHGVSE